MTDTVQYNRRLPGLILGQIEVLAEEAGTNKSQVFVEAIERFVGELEQCKSAAESEAKIFNARLPKSTRVSIKNLAEATGATETQIIMIAIDRLFRERRLLRINSTQREGSQPWESDSEKRSRESFGSS